MCENEKHVVPSKRCHGLLTVFIFKLAPETFIGVSYLYDLKSASHEKQLRRRRTLAYFAVVEGACPARLLRKLFVRQRLPQRLYPGSAYAARGLCVGELEELGIREIIWKRGDLQNEEG